MGLAGVKGVIVDWYGITGGGLSDELAASDAVIAQTSAAGMLWSLCYEDRTIREGSASAQAAQLEADWVYIRDRYINTHAGVLRDGSTGRPVFLVFGPTKIKDTATWTSMLARVFPRESERPLLLGTDRANAHTIAPDGNFAWPGWGIGTRESVAHANEVFYERASQQGFHTVVGMAFPRFKDYYRQGYAGPNPEHWWGIDVPAASGATLNACMSAARSHGAALVQAATWNDWQEGTSFEPSAEEGFAQLLGLQRHILGYEDEGQMRAAVSRYNAEKAEKWQQCDNVPPPERRDCGFHGVSQGGCEASGCCREPTSMPGVAWCFHRAAEPVCACPAESVRDCDASKSTRLDRLCCCTHENAVLTPTTSTTASEPLAVSMVSKGNAGFVAAGVAAAVLPLGLVSYVYRRRSRSRVGGRAVIRTRSAGDINGADAAPPPYPVVVSAHV